MDKTVFQQGMAYLSAAYSKEITKETAAVYWDQLGNLQDEPFMVAVRQTVGHCRWFPTVAELRRFYRDEMYRRRMDTGKIIEYKPADRETAKRHLDELKRKIRCRTE